MRDATLVLLCVHARDGLVASSGSLECFTVERGGERYSFAFRVFMFPSKFPTEVLSCPHGNDGFSSVSVASLFSIKT